MKAHGRQTAHHTDTHTMSPQNGHLVRLALAAEAQPGVATGAVLGAFVVAFVAVNLYPQSPYAIIALAVAYLAAGALMWIGGRKVAPDHHRNTLWRTRNILGSLILGTVVTTAILLIVHSNTNTFADGPVVNTALAVPIITAAPVGLILWLILLVQSLRARPDGFLPRIPAEHRASVWIAYLIAWIAGFLALALLTIPSSIAAVMVFSTIVEAAPASS